MNYLESSEDYLERILMLQNEIGTVRSIDIATSMDFSRASVSIAIKKLKDKEMIVVSEPSGVITLTKAGLKIATEIYERHSVLSTILKMIGVPEDIAMKDACKIEHDISPITFERIKEHVKKHQ